MEIVAQLHNDDSVAASDAYNAACRCITHSSFVSSNSVPCGQHSKLFPETFLETELTPA